MKCEANTSWSELHCVTWIYMDNSFAVPVHNDVLGSVALVLWYEDFHVVHWKPVGGIGLTFLSRWGCRLFDIYTISIIVILYTLKNVYVVQMFVYPTKTYKIKVLQGLWARNYNRNWLIFSFIINHMLPKIQWLFAPLTVRCLEQDCVATRVESS